MTTLGDIAQILNSVECQRINFQLENARVYGDGFKTVAQNIQKKHIQVAVSQVMPPGKALYEGKYNCIFISPDPKPQLLVHECTHALNDWHKRNILAIDDEATAYIAQATYMLLTDNAIDNFLKFERIKANTPRFVNKCYSNPDACLSAVIGTALLIAAEYLACKKPSHESIQNLRNSIQRVPDYRVNASNRTRKYDGIRRTKIPSALLLKSRSTIVRH